MSNDDDKFISGYEFWDRATFKFRKWPSLPLCFVLNRLEEVYGLLQSSSGRLVPDLEFGNVV